MIKLIGAVALLTVGLAVVAFGRKEETLQELIARAEAASPDQQANLYMEVAERQSKAVTEAVKANHQDDFRTSLQDVVKYCDKAHTAALQSNKHVKNIEIKIRKISGHLKDMKYDVEVDDQSQVQSAIDQLEKFRTELLHKMFGGKGND
jgi:hypothetical protein